MPGYTYYQLDVFARSKGGGNPLGVVFTPEPWEAARMQRLARWTNLVETTFVEPSDDADYRVRIFTPTRELPFAGHPSVGTAHAWLEHGGQPGQAGQILQQCGAGRLPVRIDEAEGRRRISVQAPAATKLEPRPRDLQLARACVENLALGSSGLGLIEGGRRWWVAELASEAQLRAWTPDHPLIRQLAYATDSLGLCVFSRSPHPDYDVAVRAFPAGVGIVEDPASGAANGLIAAWIAWHDPQDALVAGYRVSQGREMGHDALLNVSYDDAAIWVGGATDTVIRGEIHWD
ncbi:MAG: PhzF family phenazine biosynthesis protein [Xanthomonadales bacterium]|nr:PhzF family phenazine biosynthesis protein [Xanthomonadales bacterium]